MKKILSILLASIMIFTGCTNSNENTTNETQTSQGNSESTLKEKYVVGLDDTFAPMGFRDDKGELVGFDIDLSKACAEEMGIQLDYQPIDWTVKEQELETGNIDFIWNGFSITPEREEQLLMSDSYMENKQLIITMADSDVNSKADLSGKTITVQGESSALEAVKKDQDFIDSLASEPVEYATNLECFKDVEAKRSDAIVVDEVLARYYMQQNGSEKYKVLEDNFGEEVFAVGMRKDDIDLKEALDNALKSLKENGKYDEIYNKWFD